MFTFMFLFCCAKVSIYFQSANKNAKKMLFLGKKSLKFAIFCNFFRFSTTFFCNLCQQTLNITLRQNGKDRMPVWGIIDIRTCKEFIDQRLHLVV